jgi:hypothetical protein
MSYKTVFVVHAIIAIALGLFFMIVPGIALDQTGFDGRVAEKLLSQFFGVTMLTLGLVLWFVKNVTDQAILRGLAIALLIGSVLGMIISAIGLYNGMMKNNGWIAVLVYFLFAIDYAFMLFVKPKMNE